MRETMPMLETWKRSLVICCALLNIFLFLEIQYNFYLTVKYYRK
jgi:hypothetical protein